jgi:hypothetical protein
MLTQNVTVGRLGVARAALSLTSEESYPLHLFCAIDGLLLCYHPTTLNLIRLQPPPSLSPPLLSHLYPRPLLRCHLQTFRHCHCFIALSFPGSQSACLQASYDGFRSSESPCETQLECFGQSFVYFTSE